jgi:hypothetical protein
MAPKRRKLPATINEAEAVAYARELVRQFELPRSWSDRADNEAAVREALKGFAVLLPGAMLDLYNLARVGWKPAFDALAELHNDYEHANKERPRHCAIGFAHAGILSSPLPACEVRLASSGCAKIKIPKAIQADLGRPVRLAKIFRFRRRANHSYNSPVLLLEGAFRDRHERGAGCGGRRCARDERA